MPKIPALAGGIVVVTVLSSCTGPKVDFLNQDQGFDHKALSHGGIAVGGGTTKLGTWDDRVALREALTKDFETILRKERKDLRVLGAGDVRSTLGSVAYEDLMDGFDRSGDLTPEELAEMDSLVGDQVRYAAFARVEDSSVSESENEDHSDPDKTTTTLTTTRTVRVAFHVYDLQSRRSVWNATLTGEKASAKTRVEDESAGFFEGIVSGMVDSLLGLDEHPNAPRTAAVLGGIFAKFARELPHSK